MDKQNIKSEEWQPKKSGEYAKERKLGVVYGPINSRRLGLSLGINPIQSVNDETKPFACNWACVYCQYGAESADESVKKGRIRFSTIEEIKSELEKRLKSNEHYDSITVCGPTEPTLHPELDSIVQLAIDMRNSYRPGIATSLFTNATRLVDKDVSLLDFVFMKLDAGNEGTFERFNRAKISYGKLLTTLKEAKVKRKIIQTAVIGGEDGNLNDLNLTDYTERISEISPDEVHLYTLLYRPFPNFDLKPISQEELVSLGNYVQKSTGVTVKTFFDPTKLGEEFRY